MMKGIYCSCLHKDPELPKVSITRITNPGITKQISQYVLLYLLRQHRMLDTYLSQQLEKKWVPTPPPRTEETTVAILGLGRLGVDIADYLISLGFPVVGWSRTSKQYDGVDCYWGDDALPEVLRRSDYVVCTLPLTPATKGIINKDTLKFFRKGAHLINVGRGAQVVEKDLVDAIDSGRLSSATLDVFEAEPLPEDSPLWRHPKVTVTPHVAAFFVDDGISEAAKNYRRIKSGVPVPDTIDFELRY